MSSNRIENNTVFIFLRCQNESKTTVKENILQYFCFQELQDGTGLDYACSSWKLFPIKVGLSPFLLMDFYLILHYYSCTATTLYCHFQNIGSNRMMAAILNLLMRSDQEAGYSKNVHSLANGQTVTKYSAI